VILLKVKKFIEYFTENTEKPSTHLRDSIEQFDRSNEADYGKNEDDQTDEEEKPWK
jgi:hypothetical protein